MNNKVFVKLKEGKTEMQVVVFPYLGGHANSFCELSKLICNDIEVIAANPPGHGGSGLALIENIKGLAELYYRELKPIIKENCIFLGHSMGAPVSYFLVRLIMERAEYPFNPKALILSASSAPDKWAKKEYSKLPPDQLINKVVSYGGMPDSIIQEGELLRYLEPVFRADYKILESIVNVPITPVNLPAYLLYGGKDRINMIESEVQWGQYFLHKPRVSVVKDGGHMFIHEKGEEVVKFLEQIYQEV